MFGGFLLARLVRKTLILVAAVAPLCLAVQPVAQAHAAGTACAAEISVSVPKNGTPTLARGSSGTYNVRVLQIQGSAGPAALSALLETDVANDITAPLPRGLSVSFNPNPMMTETILTATKSAMTVGVASSLATGQYNIEISAVQGCATTETYIRLTVT